MENISNDFTTTLSSSILAAGVTALVVGSTGSPDVNFRIRIDNELMLVTNKGGGTNLSWTVTRGIEGTTAADHVAGATVTHVLTADSLKQLLAENRGPIPITSANFAAILAAGVPANTNLQYRVTDVTPNIIYFWNGSAYVQLGAAATTSAFIGTVKSQGAQANLIEAANVVRSGGKIRAPAHFDRLRIWVTSRETKVSSGWRFAVACTDDVAYNSVASLFTPKKAGVAHNVIQSSADELGWRIATWAEGTDRNAIPQQLSSGLLYPTSDFTQAYGTLPADSAISDLICTDWIPLSSFDPLTPDPVTGALQPWLLIRCDKISNSGVSESTSGYQIGSLGSYTAGQGYTIFRDLPAGDVVADPTLLPGSVTPDPLTNASNMPAIFIEYDFRVPVRAFAGCGDSITEGYSWQAQAINLDLHTAARPFTLANFGMSSNRPQQYEATFYNAIQSGVHVTDVLYPSFSINDAFTNQFQYNVHKLRVEQMIEFCAVNGITLWIWTCFNYFTQPQAQSINTWVRGLAAQGKCKLVDIALNWDNRSDAAGGYLNADGVHPGATYGIPYMRTTLKNAILKG